MSDATMATTAGGSTVTSRLSMLLEGFSGVLTTCCTIDHSIDHHKPCEAGVQPEEATAPDDVVMLIERLESVLRDTQDVTSTIAQSLA